jgi:hypothetical protein
MVSYPFIIPEHRQQQTYQMEKLSHYYFSWMVSFQKQRYRICEMLPLETKLSEGKLLPQSDLRGEGGSVSRGNVMQALQGDEEKDVRNYWMALRTGEDTLI